MNAVDVAFNDLVLDIRSNIQGEETASGFYAVFCPMCENKNQSQRKGGFKFDGDRIGYSCFRGSCDANTVYSKSGPIPRKFRELMDEIGVTIPIQLRAHARKGRRKLEEELDERFEKNTYKTLIMPSHFSEDLSNYWIDYLVERRVAHPDFDFRECKEGKYKGSLVIPHYFYDKVIGWDYVTRKKGYITDPSSSESMLFLPEKTIPERPIIVEGVFDALSMPNVIGAKHANITPKQAYHLRFSKPIALPDRKSSRLYEAAKRYGWDVCIPMWKEKDLNEVVKKRGILIAAKMIHDGIMPVGNKSEVMYKRWIKL